MRCLISACLAWAGVAPAFAQVLELPPAPVEAPVLPAPAVPEASPAAQAVSIERPAPSAAMQPLLAPLGAAPEETRSSSRELGEARSPSRAEALFDGIAKRKGSVALGAGLAVLAPIAYAAAPPLSALHTGWAAAASVAVVSAAASLPKRPSVSPRSKRALWLGGLLAAGLAAGGLVDGFSKGLLLCAAGTGLAASGAFLGASAAASLLPRKLAPPSTEGLASLGAMAGLLAGVAPEHFASILHAGIGAGLAAWVASRAAGLAAGVSRGAAAWFRRPRLPRPAAAAAFALGIGLGAWPSAASVPLARFEEKVARAAARALADPGSTERLPPSVRPYLPLLSYGDGFREIGPAFRDELLRTVASNPEGRKVLEQLSDRGGTLRPPRFMIGKLADGAGGFYFPVWDAVLLSEDKITARGWTVEEFLSDPAKQREAARELDFYVFHELVHARQWRRQLFFPGQFSRFPHQLDSYLHIEMEYEAHFQEYAYVHEKLKADPHATLGYEKIDYELFLTDLEEFWSDLDKTGPYRRFDHVASSYWKGRLAELRERWKSMSVEGYRLLALRSLPDSPANAEDYFKRAQDRAKALGVSPPAPL